MREYRRSKKLRLSVSPDGDVRLSVPPRTPEREIDRFLAEQEAWLSGVLARQAKRAQMLGLRRPGFVPYRGELLPVVGLLAGAGEDGDAEQALRALLRERGRRLAWDAVERQSPALGVSVARLRIADQRTRWGSASAAGTISLSWRLVLAPPAVFEYVVWHELCHLVEMNHSPAFWSLVYSGMPGYREQVAWLRRHGGELRAWAPADALGSKT